MALHNAIEQYVKLLDKSKFDERIFFNILKDLDAFSELPASQSIIRAFVTKGYLKDIWTGKSEWQMKAKDFLVNNQGYQPSIVNIVLKELELGFQNFTPLTVAPYSIHHQPSPIINAGQFKKYQREELTVERPSKPDGLRIKIGDIVMVKNGTARIASIHDDHIDVVYIKRGVDKNVRSIFYDESIEHIITPIPNQYLKNPSGMFFYVKECYVDDWSIRIIGTYSYKIRRIVLTPYTIKQKNFVTCDEKEFLDKCIDVEAFQNFRY